MLRSWEGEGGGLVWGGDEGMGVEGVEEWRRGTWKEGKGEERRGKEGKGGKTNRIGTFEFSQEHSLVCCVDAESFRYEAMKITSRFDLGGILGGLRVRHFGRS
ncbi:hypothetical protein ACMFMG_001882 [Clarireedia jacksonii]